jgi:hypothetical protein
VLREDGEDVLSDDGRVEAQKVHGAL